MDSEKIEIPIRRHFTRAGNDPFASVRWQRRTAKIADGDTVVFEQANVEVPESWSQTATGIWSTSKLAA